MTGVCDKDRKQEFVLPFLQGVRRENGFCQLITSPAFFLFMLMSLKESQTLKNNNKALNLKEVPQKFLMVIILLLQSMKKTKQQLYESFPQAGPFYLCLLACLGSGALQ